MTQPTNQVPLHIRFHLVGCLMVSGHNILFHLNVKTCTLYHISFSEYISE